MQEYVLSIHIQYAFGDKAGQALKPIVQYFREKNLGTWNIHEWKLI